MANIKVSAMPSATILNPDDLIMIVQNGSNKKASYSLFKVAPIDNLNSTSTEDPLSANQGKILNDKILALDIPTVVNNLTSTSTTDALSANQGKILNESIKNVNDSVIALGTFSKNEIKTGEVWINNKPIYKKVIEINVTDTTSHTIAHGIANVERIWVSEDSFLWVDGSAIPANYYRSASVYSNALANTINIQYQISASGWVNHTMYVTVKYTKTTD